MVPVAAVLLVAWAACCLVNRTPWGWLDSVVVTAAALAPFVSIGSVAVATAALRRRGPVGIAAAVLAVLAGLGPWLFVLGYAAPNDRPALADPHPVRAMVVTARAGVADAGAVVDAVRTHQVDLLVVTELSLTLSHNLTTAGLDRLLQPQWVSVPPEAEAGIGIWSRFAVTGITAVPGTVWPAVTARVDGRFTLVAGHVVPPIPADGRRWRSDLAAFGQAVDAARATGAGGDVVLLGNLNATPWHAAMRSLLGHGLTDAADVLGRGLRPTWPTWTPIPLVPLDHALVGDAVRVRAVDTVPISQTDHRALLVSLEV